MRKSWRIPPHSIASLLVRMQRKQCRLFAWCIPQKTYEMRKSWRIPPHSIASLLVRMQRNQCRLFAWCIPQKTYEMRKSWRIPPHSIASLLATMQRNQCRLSALCTKLLPFWYDAMLQKRRIGVCLCDKSGFHSPAPCKPSPACDISIENRMSEVCAFCS
jgi:hypothetical protein